MLSVAKPDQSLSIFKGNQGGGRVTEFRDIGGEGNGQGPQESHMVVDI